MTISSLCDVICILRRRLSSWLLRRRYRRAIEAVEVIESLGLPEDLKQAAVHRVLRRFEQRLDRFTRGA